MTHVARLLSRLFRFWAVLLLAWGVPALAQTLVSDPAQTGDTLANGNTTRKIDVHPNGTIYVCWHGSNGVRVARSLDNGATFGASVQVYATDTEAEVAVSSTGIVFVAYVSGGQAQVARSLDQGLTFQPAVAAGAVDSAQVHMATDGQYVYLIDQPGNNFLASADNGQTFTSLALDAAMVYADVHVEPGTHDVIVQVDNPNVEYFLSTDYGSTFTAMTQPVPGGNVFFSVGALSSGYQGRYLLVAGGPNLMSPGGSENVILDLANGTSAIGSSWPATDQNQTRSLAADIYGNVTTGYTSGANVLFSVSHDVGQTFGSATTVAAAVTACAAINPTNGDMLFAYQQNGAIYLSVNPALLINYELALSCSGLTYGTQTNNTSSSPKPVTVTNQSSQTVTLNSVAATGDYSQTNNAPATLAPGASFTINATFTPTASGTRNGQITITYNSTLQRIIFLTGTGTSTPGSGSPSTQASGLAMTGVGQTQMTLDWTRGNGADCAVFVAQGSSGQASPSDFLGYTANSVFGSGGTAGTGWYCVYNGTGTSVTVTGLTLSTPYQVFVCEYNGAAGAQTYNSSAGAGNLAGQTTLGAGYSVTFSTDGTVGATLTGSTSQTVAPGGDATAVTANAPAGYGFVNWTGTNGFVTATANPLTVTDVTSACAITAHFAAAAVAITNPPAATYAVSSGDTFMTSLTLSGIGLSGPVTLSAAGLPAGASCAFSSNPVDVTGGPTTVTITITTTPPFMIIGQNQGLAPWGLGTGALLACGVLARRKRRVGLFFSALAVVLAGGLTSCSSTHGVKGVTTGAPGTPAGTYQVTLTASSAGAAQATSNFQLTVN